MNKFVADMIGYAHYMLTHEKDDIACVYIVDTLNHDITGMQKTVLGMEGYEPGVFQPRSTGYAKYMPDHIKNAMSKIDNKEV